MSLRAWVWVLVVLAGGCEFPEGPRRPHERPAKVERLRRLLEEHDVTPRPAAPDVPDALYALGQALAFDKILSGNQDISCMTCHHPSHGTGDGRALPIGTGGVGLGPDRTHPEDVRVPRNAPALFNLHAMDVMFWDGRATHAYVDGSFETPAGEQLTEEMQATLTFGAAAAQAMFPVTSRDEMRGHDRDNELAKLADDDFTAIWNGLMLRLGVFPEYRELFADAYPGVPYEALTFAHAANAIAGFEIAAFESTSSPFDAFVAGDDDALSPLQLDGAVAFYEGGCAACHSGPSLTDFSFRSTARPQFGPGKGHGESGTDDQGRSAISHDDADAYRFRVPTLTNVGLTAPYGHAGQSPTLGAFLAHYDNPDLSLATYDITSQVDDAVLWDTLQPTQDALIDSLDTDVRALSPVDRRAVLAFLDALTDPAMQDLAHTIPGSVPSGLPVED